MNILQSIYNFLCDMARVRAAASLARSGDHEGARRIMME